MDGVEGEGDGRGMGMGWRGMGWRGWEKRVPPSRGRGSVDGMSLFFQIYE
ncbi:hypothetical protein GCM10010230_04720 [Streptomyces narbonensis]|nr:hypothetical protein GCM10010230_04720 [Streptomyces narbonensis]